MMSQTITLIRFFLLNYSQRKNSVLLGVILLVGFLLAQFISELSLINSSEAQFSFLIEFYRYGLILLSSLILVVAIADDFASRQFENLLSMPLSRWQYIAAQIGAIAVMNAVMVLIASSVMLIQIDFHMVIIWFVSMWLELMLCSLFALLAILSLERVPSAMILLLSLYVLSRTSVIIMDIIEQSVYFHDGDTTNEMILWLFKIISFVLPNAHAFVQNNLFFSMNFEAINLTQQLGWVALYGFFLSAIILFDFYRKEFALNKA